MKPVFKQFRKPQFIATYHFLVVVILLLLAQYLYNKGGTFIEKKILEYPSYLGIPLIERKTLQTIKSNLIQKAHLTSIDTLILEFNPLTNYSSKGSNLFEPLEIPINSCDSIQLTCVKGIGPSTSSRILKYRDRLGGFVSKFQLLEIKYFDSSLLTDENLVWIIDNSKVQKTAISESNIRILYRHPYIGKDLTKRLLSYKKFHKKLTLDDFNKMQTLSESQRKILPLYLKFDHSPK